MDRATMTLVATLGSLFAAAGLVRADVLAASYFDDDAESWTVISNCTTIPTWNPAGGHGLPDHEATGYVSIRDCQSGDPAFWIAPPSFLGDQSAAYGGRLSFCLRSSTAFPPVQTRDIVLIDSTGRDVRIRLPAEPRQEWIEFSVRVHESAGWRVGSNEGLAGPIPTQTEFVEVLSDLAQIQIRAEHTDVANVVYSLDNVVLSSACPPGDLDGDGAVGLEDLALLLAAFGTVCP